MITIEIPLTLKRGLNNREHHFKRYARERREREAVGWYLSRHQRPHTPCTVFLTRIAPSEGLDDDNLVGSFKAVRDAVAAWLNVDDKDTATVRYTYAQERGRDYGIRIEWQERSPEWQGRVP